MGRTDGPGHLEGDYSPTACDARGDTGIYGHVETLVETDPPLRFHADVGTVQGGIEKDLPPFYTVRSDKRAEADDAQFFSAEETGL